MTVPIATDDTATADQQAPSDAASTIQNVAPQVPTAPERTVVTEEASVEVAEVSVADVDTDYTSGTGYNASSTTVTGGGPVTASLETSFDASTGGDRTAAGVVTDGTGEVIAYGAGVATPTDDQSYQYGGGTYDVSGVGSAGPVDVTVSGSVNGDTNGADLNVSVDVGQASFEVPVHVPQNDIDVQAIPSPQEVMSGLQGLLGGR